MIPRNSKLMSHRQHQAKNLKLKTFDLKVKKSLKVKKKSEFKNLRIECEKRCDAKLKT